MYDFPLGNWPVNVLSKGMGLIHVGGHLKKKKKGLVKETLDGNIRCGLVIAVFILSFINYNKTDPPLLTSRRYWMNILDTKGNVKSISYASHSPWAASYCNTWASLHLDEPPCPLRLNREIDSAVSLGGAGSRFPSQGANITRSTQVRQ